MVLVHIQSQQAACPTASCCRFVCKGSAFIIRQRLWKIAVADSIDPNVRLVQILGDLKNGGVQAWIYWQVSSHAAVPMALQVNIVRLQVN